MASWLEKTTLISMIWPVPVNWPKDSQKYDIYINEEGMYDMGISGGDYDED